MNCPFCGNEIGIDGVICIKCGVVLPSRKVIYFYDHFLQDNPALGLPENRVQLDSLVSDYLKKRNVIVAAAKQEFEKVERENAERIALEEIELYEKLESEREAALIVSAECEKAKRDRRKRRLKIGVPIFVVIFALLIGFASKNYFAYLNSQKILNQDRTTIDGFFQSINAEATNGPEAQVRKIISLTMSDFSTEQMLACARDPNNVKGLHLLNMGNGIGVTETWKVNSIKLNTRVNQALSHEPKRVNNKIVDYGRVYDVSLKVDFTSQDPSRYRASPTTTTLSLWIQHRHAEFTGLNFCVKK